MHHADAGQSDQFLQIVQQIVSLVWSLLDFILDSHFVSCRLWTGNAFVFACALNMVMMDPTPPLEEVRKPGSYPSSVRFESIYAPSIHVIESY